MPYSNLSKEKLIKKLTEKDTEIKKTKAYLNTILNDIPIGIAIMEGPDLVYSHMNQTLADVNGVLLEIEPQKELVYITLFANAQDAIENTSLIVGGKISVSLKPKNSSAIIEFKDNGSGISEKNRVKLFDPFFTTKDVDKGTGLGLSISHGIIETHEGHIDCVSNEGEGSTFRIILPLI
jgi:signal transduction histidine kinase